MSEKTVEEGAQAGQSEAPANVEELAAQISKMVAEGMPVDMPRKIAQRAKAKLEAEGDVAGAKVFADALALLDEVAQIDKPPVPPVDLPIELAE